jgi:hypothetical protein
MMLESLMGIAYAAPMMPTEPIRPLHDVWLRPRRVFRELASRPVEGADYILGALQGMVGWLTLSRELDLGATSNIWSIFGKALTFGSVGGIASLLLMGAIYARLGSRAGGTSARNTVVHVLAYGGLPVAVSLGLWLLTALLAGESTFMQTPRADVENFVVLLLHAQFAASVLLAIWSVILQVMGFSEVLGLLTRKAFAIWVLGQLIGVLAYLCFQLLIALLLPTQPPT